MEGVREPVALALAGTGSQYLLAGNHLPLARGTDIMTNGSIYVGMYYSDEIIRHDLKTGEKESFRIATGHLPVNEVRRGEALFNDAKMCFQHWQS